MKTAREKIIGISMIISIIIIVMSILVIYKLKTDEKVKNEQTPEESRKEEPTLKQLTKEEKINTIMAYLCDVSATYQMQQDNTLLNSNVEKQVSIKELKEKKMINEDIINPNTGEEINSEMIVTVHYNNNEMYTCTFQ